MPHSSRRAFLDSLGVSPDTFQLQAMDALDEQRSVLVMAPTGAGKTLVADYAIARTLAAGVTAVYTTPLKALSNQKYRDLAGRLGPDQVGLITGDRTVNPGAPVLVVTTEVLRAMLYDRTGPGSGSRILASLGVVVLDEFHYLQDPERGAAWEEVVIHTPAHVPLVCLSATIPDVELVHSWLGEVHGPTTLVVADQRPVRLNQLYAVGNLRRTAPMLLPMYVDGQVNNTAELLDGGRRVTRGEGLRERDRDRPVTPSRASLIAHLHTSNLVPAIWFVLSRAGCDEAVSDCVADDVQLTSEAERVRIRSLIGEHLAPLDAAELRTVAAADWQRALEAGVAAHHGGLAPVQREVVEAAFAEGLVKVAFATETLALGINLPARTVVVDRVVRASGELLHPGEFSQLAGRAGRRGIDDTGYVVVPWSPHVPFHRVAAMAGGHLAAVTSAFRVTPAMAANLVRTGSPDRARTAVESSLRHRCDLRQAALHRADLAARRDDLADLGPDDEPEPAGTEPAGTETARPNGEAATAEHPEVSTRDLVATELAALLPGDVVVDSARPDRPMAVLGVRSKRGTACVEVIRDDGRRVQLTPTSLRGRPVVVTRVDLPAWAPTKRGHAKRATDVLSHLDLPPVEVSAPRPDRRARAATNDRARAVRERRRLTKAIADLDALLTETTTASRVELDKVVRLLERRGHVVNWTLTTSGDVVRRLFHPAGLLLAECLVTGVLDELDPASLASAASWFTVRTRLGGPRSTGIATPELSRRWEAVRACARSVHADEVAEGLPLTPHPEAALGVPVYRWVDGAPLDAALAGSGVPVGDLIREIRQVAELLEQLETVPGGHRAAAKEGATALRRGALVTAGEWAPSAV